MGRVEKMGKYSSYDERRELFKQYNGQKVIITVARTDHLCQPDGSITDIPYTTTHFGKIKDNVFYAYGKRSPFNFMGCELVGLKRR